MLNASCATNFPCNCNFSSHTLYKHLSYLLSRLNTLTCTMYCAQFVKMPLASLWAARASQLSFVAGLPAALSSGLSLLQHALPAANPGIPALVWVPQECTDPFWSEVGLQQPSVCWFLCKIHPRRSTPRPSACLQQWHPLAWSSLLRTSAFSGLEPAGSHPWPAAPGC